MTSPKIDVDSIEHSQEGETPGDSVNNNSFARGEELVDDGPEEKNVNQGPYEESPWSRCHVCFLSVEIDAFWRGNSVYV